MKRNLRDRLRESFEVGEPRADPPPVRGGEALRDYLKRRADRARSGVAGRRVTLPEGVECTNERGTFWVRRQEYEGTHRHGHLRLDAAADVDWTRVGELARDGIFARSRLDECLFLDTETTGLSGGAGTTVFLTGIGWFERDRLVLEQVFLRSFAEEEAALRHVARRLAERPLPVTFVGKAFDRHRLAARMAVCRVRSDVLQPRHLDLYYLARRAWREALPDVRLRTVEERCLGIHRRGDLPGSEAPRAWLGWLRDGTGAVDDVLEHNRVDVLSLVALLARLGDPSGA